MSSDIVEKKEHVFNWKIEDFSLCTKKKGEYFESPIFRAKSLFDTSWCIRFYPRGGSDSDENYLGCALRRCKIDNGDHKIESEFVISIINDKGKIIQWQKTSHLFPKNETFGWNNFWKKPIQSSDTSDVLLVRCNLKVNPQKNILRSESSGVTSFQSDNCSFNWIIKDLNSDCSGETKFPYTGSSQVEILIQVVDDDIKITMHRGEGVTEPKSVMCRITLLDVKGGKHDSRQEKHFFETKNSPCEKDSWEFPTFLKKSKLNSEKEKYLKDDSFALECKIVISDGTQIDSIVEIDCDTSAVDVSHTDAGTTTVLEDYKKLFSDKIHSDVKLLVHGQIIKAHKNILAIRSPVFLAMFDNDMVEKETGSVTIPDLDAETVTSLLEYMYIGSVEKLDYELAVKLIVAADKYEVLSLKEKCAYFLKSVLCHANVCEILVIADLIQNEILKCAAVNYIKDNAEYVFLSEEWNTLAEKNLKLATHIFSQVSKLTAADCKKLEQK